MGENARVEKIRPILNFIDECLRDFGFEGDDRLVELFNKYYNEVKLVIR